MLSQWQARRDSCNNSQYNFRSHMQRVNAMELSCWHLLGDLLLPWRAHMSSHAHRSASRTPTMVLGRQGVSTPTVCSCSSTQRGLQMRATSSRDSSSLLTALLHTTVQEQWDLPICHFTLVQWIIVDNSAIPATGQEAVLGSFYCIGTHSVPRANLISLSR